MIKRILISTKGGIVMKNLEDKNILSEEILYAVSLILKQSPNAVFGGSIALNAIGLINRPISDIDLFFGLNESLSSNGYLSIESIGEITSDTVTNTNGIEIQRTGAKIAGVKTCCFKVSEEELQSTKHRFTRNGIEYTICIQNVNYAIEAKRSYASRNTKHQNDLNSIAEVLENIV